MPNFRKVVSLGGVWELPPPTLQRAASGTWFESVVRYVLRPLWGWRLELGTGVHLNVVAPEQAAAELRDA